MYYIYTENFYWWSRLKNLVKKILGKQNRGPKAVFESLCRGFKDLGQDFIVNKNITTPIETAYVLSGVKTLAWVIKQKQKGLIKKIIAGPNIVVTPIDYNGIITNENINTILVPSDWNKNWWLGLEPKLTNRIKVWATGAKDRGETKEENKQILVFQKNAPHAVFKTVVEKLKQMKIPFRTLYYGHFAQQDYYNLVSKTSFIIYLSNSESQGLALLEAWMANVPTLVWNPEVLNYKQYLIKDQKLSAPYLSASSGSFFKGQEDFAEALEKFINQLNTFKPRQYALQNFTDKICAQKYLNIAAEIKSS